LGENESFFAKLIIVCFYSSEKEEGIFSLTRLFSLKESFIVSLKDKIIEELQTVIDPETTIDIISMGLIKDLKITPENNVSFKFGPSSSVCPLAFPLALEIQKKVSQIPEVNNLRITVINHQKAEELNQLLQDESG